MTTTDPQDERFDLYDDSGEPLGTSKPRGAVHRDGDWHRSLHLWVWGIANDEPFVIFQCRSMTKDTWPGALDVAVGGHFRSGESLPETLREAEEEIGLAVNERDVVHLGRRFHDWRKEALHDREINEVYAVRCDQPLSAYRLHPEEIDDLIQMPLTDGLRLFQQAVPQINVLSYRPADGTLRKIRVATGDFVDTSDGYALRTLQSIRQLAVRQSPETFIIRGRSSFAHLPPNAR